MQTVRDRNPRSETAEALIRAHYEDFNTRRLQAAAARFHAEARIENITGQVACGADGFLLLQLGEYLAAENDPAKQRELVERMGQQLDAARHVVRPYFRTNQ